MPFVNIWQQEMASQTLEIRCWENWHRESCKCQILKVIYFLVGKLSQIIFLYRVLCARLKKVDNLRDLFITHLKLINYKLCRLFFILTLNPRLQNLNYMCSWQHKKGFSKEQCDYYFKSKVIEIILNEVVNITFVSSFYVQITTWRIQSIFNLCT